MRKLLNGFKNQKGFTLIELLVVVAIIGVLAAIVTPNLISFMNAGQVEALKANTASVQTAEDAYAASNAGVYAESSGAVDFSKLVPLYLRATPTPGIFTIDVNGKVTGTPE